jgi:hypothetical protein
MPEETTSPQLSVDDRPAWRTSLEFLQLLGVLSFAVAVILPLAQSPVGLLVWIGSPVCIAAGCGLVYWSLRLIPKNDVAVYVITDTRLKILRTTGTPVDIVDSIEEIRNQGTWNGSGLDFRDRFFSLVGTKRGEMYLPRVLPYLAAYEVKRSGGGSQPTTA